METRMLTLRLDAETFARVEAEAQVRGRSVSDLVRTAVRAYLRAAASVSPADRVILSYLIGTRRILNFLASEQLGTARVTAFLAEVEQGLPARLTEVLRDLEDAS